MPAHCDMHAEYLKICSKTAIGFIVMGFIGFFVKLIFIVSCCCSGTSTPSADFPQPPHGTVLYQPTRPVLSFLAAHQPDHHGELRVSGLYTLCWMVRATSTCAHWARLYRLPLCLPCPDHTHFPHAYAGRGCAAGWGQQAAWGETKRRRLVTRGPVGRSFPASFSFR